MKTKEQRNKTKIYTSQEQTKNVVKIKTRDELKSVCLEIYKTHIKTKRKQTKRAKTLTQQMILKNNRRIWLMKISDVWASDVSWSAIITYKQIKLT